MRSPRFTRPLLAFAIGVPLAWAVLLWFHPNVDPNHVYADLRDNVVAYQIVHAGTLVFIGLLGLALSLLVRDLPGRAARVSRLAIGPFVLFYAAYESVIGLAVGALVQHGNDAPLRQRPAVADTIQSLGEQRDCRGPRHSGHRRIAGLDRRRPRGRRRIPPRWRAAPSSRTHAHTELGLSGLNGQRGGRFLLRAIQNALGQGRLRLLHFAWFRRPVRHVAFAAGVG